MANLNKVMLIGRLTKDPEMVSFANGGKVAKIRFAVNNRKKNQSTGQWEDVPVYLDVEAFNREQGRKLADLVEQYLKKGHQVYIEGNLWMDEWTDKNDGQKRTKLKVVLQELQFLEGRQDGANNMGGSGMTEGGARPMPRMAQAGAAPKPPAPAYSEDDHGSNGGDVPPPRNGNEDDIPF